ncbi:MAG: glycoside hydrolase family 3 protein [Ruminococcus sp.]|nr:glycoside hydrolase family 3 protein [Ruminococcus sp.]
MKARRFLAFAMCMSFVLCSCAESKKENSKETSEEVTTEEVTEAPTEPTEPPVPEKTVPEKMLESMTLEEKVCQMFITTPEQLSGYDIVTLYDEVVEEAINEKNIGGLIFFDGNFETAEQTTEMISAIQDCALNQNGIGMFMSVDEEGGTVARVADNLGTTAFDDMVVYGEQNDTHVSYEIGYTIGTDIKALGFNLDFAPVADVNLSDTNELGGRIFSTDPQIVADMAVNVATGLKDAGVCATMKHFPGLGAEEGNTHTDSEVAINRTMEELKSTELVPFRAGITAGVDFIMVGHQAVSGVGDWLPSDLSYPVVTELLRNELAFNGIIITDSHMMNTIADVYSSGEASVMAVNAGVDIILMPSDLAESVDTICSAVESGTISQARIDESVLRILNKKYEMGLINENAGAKTPTETEEETTATDESAEGEETTTSAEGEETEETTESSEEPTQAQGEVTMKQSNTAYVAGGFVNPSPTTTVASGGGIEYYFDGYGNKYYYDDYDNVVYVEFDYYDEDGEGHYYDE